MNKEEFLNKIKELGTIEDEVQRRTLLAEISDEVSKVYDSNETLTTSNTKYEEDNEKLRSANMELFLRVGSSKPVKEVNENSTGIKNPDEDKRKFEDLFNEKGGLK